MFLCICADLSWIEADQMQDESVWGLDINLVLFKDVIRKVLKVLRYNDTCPPRIAATSTWRSFGSGNVSAGMSCS
jgi:hypothetical protein